MMYNNKMIAVIKVDGKILREKEETVYIPFGAEYSIHFKNLHSVDAVVDITIDEDDVLDFSRLVVRANGENKVEGFLKGNDVSHKFKFIEKTQEISEYRGDKISDGLIRISFQFEMPKKDVWTQYDTPIYRKGVAGIADPYPPLGTLQTRHFGPGTHTTFGSSLDSIQISANTSQVVNDDGITVKGSDSDQAFVNTTIGALEPETHVIVFQLKGETSTGQVIEQPILVKTKIRCETCGKLSTPLAKFCSKCGTSVVI